MSGSPLPTSANHRLFIAFITAAALHATCWDAHGQMFTDATAAAGLSVTPRPSMGNPIWGDLNNDGRLDLFMSRHQRGYSLYANNGDGTFRDLQVLNYDTPDNYDLHCGTMGDFNNDGLLDLFIGYGAAGGARVGVKYDQIYINRGNQRPLELSNFLGVTNQQGRVQCVCLLDLDLNGYLDIFVINRASPNLFWRNNGDGTTTEIAVSLGLDDTPTIFNPMGTMGEFASWIDYDRDGDLDVMMLRSGDRMLRNDGGSSFTNVTSSVGLTSPVGHHAAAWGDYNNDGYIDLFLTGRSGEVSVNVLYQNSENGTFTNVTAQAGVNSHSTSDPRGAAWGDYDNDGDLDLFIASNDADVVANGLDILYRNNGDGSFTDVTVLEGLTTVATGRAEGCAWGDYTNNGFLDLVVNNGGLFSEDLFPEGRDILYRNQGNSNGWIKVIPEGTISNRSALGTKVWITTGSQLQFRELTDGGMGKLRTQGLVPLHFGLGSAQQVDELTIEWPNGLVESYQNLPINQTHRLIEGAAP